MVNLLVESGACIDKRDSCGQTCLLIACKLQHLEMVQYLVSKGSNVNATDKDSNTPLLLAIDSGLNINTSLVKFLLNVGADPNHSNLNGFTPLLNTIRRSSDHILDGQDIVQALLEHNCHVDVHEYKFYGESALNISITRNQDGITEKLIRSGANVDEKSINGQSPFMRLIMEDKIDLAKLALANSRLPIGQFPIGLEHIQRMIKNQDVELFNHLLKEYNLVPRLKHLCRIKLRKWFSFKADLVIQQIQIPPTLQQYLLLKEL